MGRLRYAREVIKIAADLDLQGHDPVRAIMSHCDNQVESWLAKFPTPTTLIAFHKIITDRLNIHHVVVATDEELDALVREQTSRGEVIFHTLKDEFAQGTQAITFKLAHAVRGMKKHLAVVDGRGDRAPRVYFSKRHEDSHILTLSPHQLSFVFRRTHLRRANAEEALMDKIAGRLAFYPLLFQPQLHRLQRRYGRPCLQLVEDLQQSVCPEASYTATAIATIEQNELPALLIDARYSAKRGDNSVPPASWTLRATSVRASAAAKQAGLMIPWNYRIPTNSLISQAFHDALARLHDHADERLGGWRSSDGSRLPDLPVHVEVRKYSDYVVALITLN
jgi:hypothetical protein